jgi:hypothetical protein
MRTMFLAPFVAILCLQSTPPAEVPPAAPPPAAEPVPATPPTEPATPTADPAAPPAATPATAKPKPLVPSASDLPPEEFTRAYIVVDRVSTAAGKIESDDEAVIVLRDEKGRVRSFTKNRVLAVKYLLDGPTGRRVRVIFNDSRVLVGNLVEDGYEAVSVEIEGITAKYPREAVNEVLPDAGATLAAAHATAAEIASNSPLVTRGIKDVLDEQRTADVAASLRYVAAWNSAFLPSRDLKEGISAMFAKREPNFTGE